MSTETIYALSSAPGKAGVCVIRVSGPDALSSLKKMASFSTDPEFRKAHLKSIKNPVDGNIIDNALIIAFRAPFSFTGEDVVEYQLHGSPAVIDAVMSTLSSFDNHRMAEHGEFTRRAFENGKIDLTEAEAVADLIDAETQAQKDQALLQMGGALSRLYEGWRERLIRVMAYIEAVIDFPDEEIPDDQVKTMLPELKALYGDIQAHLNDKRKGERLRQGIRVVILGAPNAGKSSLLNTLSQRDVAIVSDMAGTTRDILDTHLNIAGYPVILSDTAGLRQNALHDNSGHNNIEREGMRRAIERANDADIRILLFDGTKNADVETQALDFENAIVVRNKADLKEFTSVDNVVSISANTGTGIQTLLEAMEHKIKALYRFSKEAPSLTRARHRSALQECASCLEDAMNVSAPELMAEDVRMAARSLGRITGRVDVEDLLDVIFKDFCIGK